MGIVSTIKDHRGYTVAVAIVAFLVISSEIVPFVTGKNSLPELLEIFDTGIKTERTDTLERINNLDPKKDNKLQDIENNIALETGSNKKNTEITTKIYLKNKCLVNDPSIECLWE